MLRRRHLPAIVTATIIVVAFVGTQAGLGAGTRDGWTSSLKTGDVVERGTVWRVTATPQPDAVDFWASDRLIATDKSAPFEVPLDLASGDYKIGFCYRKDDVQKCATTETGAGDGIVARIKIVDPAPPTSSAPPPPRDSGSTPPTSTNESSSPSTSGADKAAPKAVRRINVTSADSSSVSVAWPSSQDNVGVAGYGLFLSGKSAGATPETRYTFAGLGCGTGYLVGVDAYDAAGNHSQPTSTTVSTSACRDLTAPTAPTAVRLAAATDTSVVLSWKASSDNIGVVGYGLYVGGLRVGSTSEPAATLTSLRCATSYEVGIDAVDAAGNRSARVSSYFSTLPCPGDKIAPSQPNKLAVSAAAADSITLSWAASTDNTGVTSYGLYRGSSRVDATAQTSATFTGLTCGTAYQLGVDASDAAGNRSAVASVSASTQPCAPSTPVNGWTSSLKTGDVVGRGTVWRVTVTPQPAEVDFWASDRVIATDKSAPFEVPLDLVPGDYKLGFCSRKDDVQKCASTETGAGEGIVARVTVTDAVPQSTGDTTPPTVPGSLRVTSTGTTSVSVAWNASTDNTGVSSYGLYRGSSRVDATAQTSATFTGLTCGTAYQLGVDASDAAGNRSAVASVSASTQPCAPSGDSVAPSTPGNLRVVTAAPTSLNMSWARSTDNVGVAGYGEYRGSSRVGTTSQTTTTFSSLSCGTAYDLGVDAYDTAGNRSTRANMTATTSACPDTKAPSAPTNVVVGTRTATSIALSWSPSVDDVGIVGYGVYRDGSRVSTIAGTTGIVSGLTCGTNYTLAVDAYDAAGNRSGQAVVMVATTACVDTQAPTVPTGLTGSNVTQTSLTLVWIASADNVGVTGYVVSRNGSTLGQPTVTSYAVTGLACGTTSTFDVQAKDAAGNTSTKTSLQVATAACSSTPPAGSVYLSPSGSDSAACSSAAPCKSVQRGFQVAQAGQTVTLATGEYGTQTLENAHKTVTFKGSGAHFTSLSLTCTTGITLDGINSIQIAALAGNDSLVVKGGRFGGGTYRANEEKDPIVLGDVGSCSKGDLSNGITLDGVYVGDYMFPNGDPGSAHPDCLQLYGGTDGVTVRNSTFSRCEDSFIGAYPDFGDIRNVTVENNTFQNLGNRTYWSSQWGQPGHPGRCDGITFRGNTFDPNNPGALGPYSSLRTECWNMTVEGNTFKGNGPGSDACAAWKASWNTVWRSNVFNRSGGCSSG